MKRLYITFLLAVLLVYSDSGFLCLKHHDVGTVMDEGLVSFEGGHIALEENQDFDVGASVQVCHLHVHSATYPEIIFIYCAMYVMFLLTFIPI